VRAPLSGLDALLADSSFRDELRSRMSPVFREELGGWLEKGQIVLTSVDLSEPLGLSGPALQRELKLILAGALLSDGRVDLQTAAVVAGLALSELPRALERYGVEPWNDPDRRWKSGGA
jgi:predicted HTH domain antitoxin